MYTAIIIVIALFFSANLNSWRLKNSNDKVATENSNTRISFLIFAITAIICICINFWPATQNSLDSNTDVAERDTVIANPKQRFLIDNGLNPTADLSDGQFAEIKELIESGVLGNKSFCDVVIESREIANNKGDLNKFYSQYKFKNFDVIISMYGANLCKYAFHKSEVSYTKEDIDKQFNLYDGSHKKTEEYVKSHMKNPDSYEHVSSQYKERKNYLEVILTYRGTNSYGGVVTEKVRTHCDLKTGEVLKIEEI